MHDPMKKRRFHLELHGKGIDLVFSTKFDDLFSQVARIFDASASQGRQQSQVSIIPMPASAMPMPGAMGVGPGFVPFGPNAGHDEQTHAAARHVLQSLFGGMCETLLKDAQTMITSEIERRQQRLS
jgi:hypothetical protein